MVLDTRITRVWRIPLMMRSLQTLFGTKVNKLSPGWFIVARNLLSPQRRRWRWSSTISATVWCSNDRSVGPSLLRACRRSTGASRYRLQVWYKGSIPRRRQHACLVRERVHHDSGHAQTTIALKICSRHRFLRLRNKVWMDERSLVIVEDGMTNARDEIVLELAIRRLLWWPKFKRVHHDNLWCQNECDGLGWCGCGSTAGAHVIWGHHFSK